MFWLSCSIGPFTVHHGISYRAWSIYPHQVYLKDYNVIFTRLRFKLVGVFYPIFVLYQLTTTTITLVCKGPRKAGKYTLQLNVFVLIGIIFFYIRSIIILKKHLKSTQEISSVKRNIVKIAAPYFYFYLINIGILMIYRAVENWTTVLDGVDASSKGVIGIIHFIFPGLTTIVNAFGSLWTNIKLRDR